MTLVVSRSWEKMGVLGETESKQEARKAHGGPREVRKEMRNMVNAMKAKDGISDAQDDTRH